jgi:cytochrome P450
MCVRLTETPHQPILPHSFLLGHLGIAARYTMRAPDDLATAMVPYFIADDNPEIRKYGYFYLDMWPVAHQMIVVHHPDIIAQFTQEPSFPKHLQLPWEFEPMSHGLDLVTSNGQHWKTWRSTFNPAFASKNIQTYIPVMLEEYNIFRSKLESFASKKETFKMDNHAMALTVDIIGHAVL